MSKLSAAQAIDLAEEFADAAESLRQWRLANKSTITTGENERLRTKTVSLSMMAQIVATDAVGLALDEATVTLAGLESATSRAKKAIKNVKTAKKTIELSAAVMSLAAAIVSKDPNGVSGSLQTLVKTIGEVSASKKTTAKKTTAKKPARKTTQRTTG